MRQATEEMFRDVLPWRTFRWYYGQQHYSGSYWASTMSAHVIYESRLELARLLMADFDTSVNHIVAQPFLMRRQSTDSVVGTSLTICCSPTTARWWWM